MAAPFAEELAFARTVAAEASAIILTTGPAAVLTKTDGSPVTSADMAANEIIESAIRARFPQDGVLSEESLDNLKRLKNDRVWIIDPLDGTRDFVQKTAQYAVHIGLAVRGRATLGVVAEPAANRMSWAVLGQGAFVEEGRGPARRLAVSDEKNLAAFRIGVSRLALSPNVQKFLCAEPPLQAVAMGASTKLMALVRGELHACVWLGAAEKEWDTCAPDVIVHEAGGRITDVLGHPFVYNKTNVAHSHGIVASNGPMHAALLKRAGHFFP